MITLLLLLAAVPAVLLCLGFFYRPPDMSAFDTPVAPLIKEEHEISDQHRGIVRRLAEYHAGPMPTNIRAGREKFEQFFALEVNTPTRAVNLCGLSGEWVLAEGADPNCRLLYIHGGAFMVGSPKTHRFITSELSRRTGAAVFAIDYRKRPEFRIIRCHEDVRTAYEWILGNGPEGAQPAASLFVAGDSAGGNLTLAVIAWARDQGLPPADGAIALAPLTDATMSSRTWIENIGTDPFLGPGIGRLLKIPRLLRLILGHIQNGKPGRHPELSPLFGHLGRLPPTLIQVSRHEMLFGDAQRYANKARQEGGDVTLQVWPKLVHVFQGFDGLPEADEALGRIADFIASKANRAAAG